MNKVEIYNKTPHILELEVKSTYIVKPNDIPWTFLRDADKITVTVRLAEGED